jgi:hypothetical protein
VEHCKLDLAVARAAEFRAQSCGPQLVLSNLLLEPINDALQTRIRRDEIPPVQSRSSGLTSSRTNASAQSNCA